MGGSGVLHTAESLKGHTLTKVLERSAVAVHNLYKGRAFFELYKETSVTLESGKGRAGAVPCSGYVESRLESNWGRSSVNFPAGAVGTPDDGIRRTIEDSPAKFDIQL